jgi:hypothetical protein
MCPMNFAKFPMDDQTCKFQVKAELFDKKNFYLFQTNRKLSRQLKIEFCKSALELLKKPNSILFCVLLE